jgi:hypothetical protein
MRAPRPPTVVRPRSAGAGWLAARSPAVAAVGLALGVAVAGAPRAHAGVAFVESTSELDDGKPRTSMWNAADDNDGTMWCAQKGAARKEAVSFTFDETVTVTHVGVMLPRAGEGVDKSVRRPKVVMVADVEHRVEVQLRDNPTLQVLELAQAARGRRVVVEVLDTFPGATDDAPLCIATVSLRDKTRELTGEVAAKARGLNTPSRRLLHEWHDDLSAPSRTLLFNADGTFAYVFAPLLDEGKPVKLKGKWLADGDSVVLDVRGKSFLLKTRLTKVASSDGSTVELSLSGDAPDASMSVTYHPAPILLP